jgi:hypothetical protein
VLPGGFKGRLTGFIPSAARLTGLLKRETAGQLRRPGFATIKMSGYMPHMKQGIISRCVYHCRAYLLIGRMILRCGPEFASRKLTIEEIP